MYRISRGLPDAIEFRIGRFEAAFELHWIDDGFSADVKLRDRSSAKKTNSHISKCRLWTTRGPLRWDIHQISTEIVPTTLLAGNACGERLDFRLSIGDRDHGHLCR